MQQFKMQLARMSHCNKKSLLISPYAWLQYDHKGYNKKKRQPSLSLGRAGNVVTVRMKNDNICALIENISLNVDL